MPDKISIVIPALNEAETVGAVVQALKSQTAVDEVIVVDNASSDQTTAAAEAAGARAVQESEAGMGHALRAGFRAARNDWIIKIDADLATFNPDLVQILVAACGPDVGLVKGNWQEPGEDMPMTRYLIKPAIRLLVPELAHLDAPNSGIYLFDRSRISLDDLHGGIAADIDVMLRVQAAGHVVAEASIGEIKNDPRTTGHYNTMAETILKFFLDYKAQRKG